jgi:hypothetical protein
MITKAFCPCRRTASPQTQRTAARQQATRCATFKTDRIYQWELGEQQ